SITTDIESSYKTLRERNSSLAQIDYLLAKRIEKISPGTEEGARKEIFFQEWKRSTGGTLFLSGTQDGRGRNSFSLRRARWTWARKGLILSWAREIGMQEVQGT
ncbi:hypothetical protein KI387_000777, partial [Taxus chinensis]